MKKSELLVMIYHLAEEVSAAERRLDDLALANKAEATERAKLDARIVRLAKRVTELEEANRVAGERNKNVAKSMLDTIGASRLGPIFSGAPVPAVQGAAAVNWPAATWSRIATASPPVGAGLANPDSFAMHPGGGYSTAGLVSMIRVDGRMLR